MCADKARAASYRFAPIHSVAGVLRRDCQSGRNLGVVIERSVLLDSLALYLAVVGTRKGADTQVRPYGLERDAGQIAQAAPAERERKGIRDLPGDFHQTSTRGQGGISSAQGSPCAGRSPPGFIGNDSGQPPYLSQLARTCKFGAKRFFLLDRPRPVLFLSRTKREWGVESPGDHRTSPRRRAAPFFCRKKFLLSPLDKSGKCVIVLIR